MARQAPNPRYTRTARAQAQRDRRRRRTWAALVVAALAVVGAVVLLVVSPLWQNMFGSPADFRGDGDNDVVFQVHPGDSTSVIAEALVDQDIVATTEKFLETARGNEAIVAIQPGFYRLRTRIPSAVAVSKLADPANRVGKVTVPEGRQLDDITYIKTGEVTDGIFTLISKASCVNLDDETRCVSADDLRAAAGSSSLAALKVPEWATARVEAMGTDHRRIEGLIAPGTWNVDPAATPEQMLASLIEVGAAHYREAGLLETANTLNMSAYDVVVVASLLQKEAKPDDFAKVARVIYNRLNEPQRLEFDSTVNYPLDRQEVATTDADREQITPWNTYASDGLPVTPIGSPGDPALKAAEHPEPGDWLYFVTIDDQGTTLFTRDYQQHLANIELAKHNGVLDSAR